MLSGVGSLLGSLPLSIRRAFGAGVHLRHPAWPLDDSLKIKAENQA